MRGIGDGLDQLFVTYLRICVQRVKMIADFSWMPLSGLLTVTLLTLAYVYYRTVGRKHNDINDLRIPGPLNLPFFGTKWVYLWRYKLNKLHEAYADMHKRYGDVFLEVDGWGHCTVSVVGRNALNAVLRGRATGKRPLRPPAPIALKYRKARPDRYASAGIVNEQGETWFNLRKALTSELTSPKTMIRFLPELNVICDDFVNLLAKNRKDGGQVHGFDQFTNRMGLETTCALMLGERMTFLDHIVSGKARLLATAVKRQFEAQRDSYFGWPLWKYFPTPLYNKYCESEDIIYNIISELVDKAIKSNKETYCDGMQSVFVSILENPDLDIRDKKAAIVDFIAAGIETLANSLVFLLYLLAKHKDAQECIYKELQEIAPNANHLTAEELAMASYARACMNESFRLLPTAFCLGRVLEASVDIDSYQLPPGTYVNCHTMLTCRQEENFPDPMEFRPERWLSMEGEACKYPFLVVPFGVGSRMCPGKRFVEMELQLILMKIIQQFSVEYDGELDIQFDFLLTPKSNVTFRLKERATRL